MPRLSPLSSLRLFFLSVLALGITFFIGMAAPGLDAPEKCVLSGEIFDRDYWDQHYREFQQVFPMHSMCNANYDLVPVWVNPALVIFAVLAVTFLIAFITSGVVRPRARAKESSTNDDKD